MSASQIKIFHDAICLGCGEKALCLEIGVTDGLTLACRECITTIFDRSQLAVEDNLKK